jgi:hypothetical protein
VNTLQKRIVALGVLGILGTLTTAALLREKKNLGDEALLALIKNDQKAFESFLDQAGDVHGKLPVIDGEVYTIAQGISHFERTKFLRLLRERKKSYVAQSEGQKYDIVSLAVKKNNLELLAEIDLERPNYGLTYNEKGWGLLHLASASCAQKVIPHLHQKGKLSWDLKAKDGSTPLTLAAQNDCLGALSYWKEQNADFNAKDGRGLSALSILRQKKDAALVAFAESFEPRKPSSVAQVPNFYKKRKIPKDQIVDHAALIEPGDRPLEATETAEYSEFAD